MTSAELDVLEQDVANARRRLVSDLARLRSPETLSGFKNDLVARAQEAKDQLVQKATDSATDGIHRIVADVKARVAANPVASLAVGAGIVWRLVRHPPIATLLVGAGLASLFRTDPNRGSADMLTRASNVAGTVGERVQKWGEEARDVTQQTVSQISSTASDMGAQAKQLAHRTLGDHDLRDSYLLGAAALAIGAATVISYQRRNHSQRIDEF